MRVKSIISAITFILAFTCSAALATFLMPSRTTDFTFTSFDTATAEDISTFIKQDVANGEDRDAKLKSVKCKYRLSSTSAFYISEYTATTTEYVDKASALDESNLPQDFQNAWLKHLRAWNKYEELMQKYPTMENSEFYQLERQYDREISVTWFNVLRAARSYGAEIPKNAY